MGRGMYFEDLELGFSFTTGARTITSTDIVNFACLSGDFNEVHSNWEYCKDTPFGEPIAHGPMIYAICGGLSYAAGFNEGTALALLGITDWKLLRPVKHGDTIRMESVVVGRKLSRKPDRGTVTFRRMILNQRDELVQQMTATLLYRTRGS